MKLLIAIALGVASLTANAADLTRHENVVVAYEAKDQTTPPPQDAIVVVGSSTIRLWGSMQADLAPLVTINRGISGSTIDEIDYYLQRLVLVHKPRAVVIYEGDNDLWEGATPQYITTRFGVVAGKIHAKFPQARVYVISIKPSASRWDLWDSSKQTNQLLKNWTKTDARLAYIDAGTPLLGSDGMPNGGYYNSDQLHLNASGYQVWTAAIKPALIAGESGSRVLPKAPSSVLVQ